ncbi:diadenylate cyclase [Myxococcus sp. XM-1-1-1]|uniref:diadenylate cyclase n=1 Tax=Myxococcus sp. XM-1-1-1 TaxID=2874602 RepID=UPI001CBA6FA3|nr:diadenylate cyclase [Myxococcus sp. XM-1-1-1]MBZ4414681.1 diadenylate cyclase [Myxococcus sp. XM-1-1-1]
MVATDFIVWGYQPHFCAVASNRAKTLFDALGPSLAAEVFLVGLSNGRPGLPEVILQAEQPEALAHALEGLSKTLEEVTEEQRVFGRYHFIAGPAGVAERHEQRVLLGVAGRSVLKHLQQGPLAAERRFWVGSAHNIGDYRFVPVLSLSKAVVERYPSLSKTHAMGVSIPTSLIETVADELIKLCSRALRLPNAGESIREDLDFGDPEEVIRRAASNLMYVPVFAGGKVEGLGALFSICDALSAEPYERSETHATLFVCKQEHPSIEPLLEMVEPVELRSARAARKVLQMSAAGLSMLSDGMFIWGLGRLSSRVPYEATREDLFEIRFTGRLRWELRHADTVLFQVENRRVMFPHVRLMQTDFGVFLNRVFPHLAAQNVSQLWDCISSVLAARHGAILIITQDAAGEAERLKSQGTPITPKLLEPGVVAAATRIDGAVLLDTAGVCYAIGVILDGVVTPEGMRSRGSRFNSALQYVTYRRGSVAVVVSDDGSVDLLPSLRPKVPRSALTSALGELRALASGDRPFGQMGRIMNALYALEFYLSAEECAEVNRLRVEIEAAHPPELFEIRLVYRDLVPSPGMNASYFTDDSSS